MSVKYYNKMPFPVKFRQIWLPNNPSIELPSGGVIEGPSDVLERYSFLAPLPFDFHRVESVIQGTNFEYRDEMLNAEEKIEIISGPETAEEERIHDITAPIEEQQKAENAAPVEQELTMPFDPKTVNWLGVKVADLELAAKILGIKTDHLKETKPKEKKWQLVNLIKNATNV